MNKYQILMIIGAICFFVGLIDDLITHAANYSEFNLLGKVCCIGVVVCISGWIISMIYDKVRS